MSDGLAGIDVHVIAVIQFKYRNSRREVSFRIPGSADIDTWDGAAESALAIMAACIPEYALATTLYLMDIKRVTLALSANAEGRQTATRTIEVVGAPEIRIRHNCLICGEDRNQQRDHHCTRTA